MRIIRWILFGMVCLLGMAGAIARADDAPSPAAMENSAHAQLQEILRRPQYVAWRLRQQGESEEDFKVPSKWSQFVATQWRKIRDLIRRLFHRKHSNPPPAPSGRGLSEFLHYAAWIVVGILVIYLAIVSVKILRSRETATMARVLSQEQVREAMESGNALALDSAQWMEQARRLAGEQDFRAVYRALYLALLSGLHAAGKIEHNRNRTNWVYVEHYRGPAPERARFSDLTELFDRVWYGRKIAQDDNLEQLRLDVAMLTRGEGAA